MIDLMGPRGAFVGRQPIDLSEWYDVILCLLDRGWTRAAVCQGRNAHSDERSLTEYLRNGMREELGAGVSEWCKRMTILRGTESKSVSSPLKPDGLTDIPVYLHDIRERYDDHEPHAIIECKRVTERCARLVRLYVSKGIDRFRSGQYACNHRAGIMVGYVLEGSVEGLVAKINKRLRRIRRNSESLQQSSVVRARSAWVSFHPRPEPLIAIELHHTFLTF